MSFKQFVPPKRRPGRLFTLLGGRNERSGPGRTAAPVLAQTRPAMRRPDRPGPVSAQPGPAPARRYVRVLDSTVTTVPDASANAERIELVESNARTISRA